MKNTDTITMANLIFRIADKQSEFDQINRLNYETFVEEIPQHKINTAKILVDKFHDQNTYIICLDGTTLVGMLAVRGQRPFSLDYKLDNLDSYLPEGKSVCEIRLLSVKKEYRHTGIFSGLMNVTMNFCDQNNFDMAVISGTLRQLKLYYHLGFIPFGPVVGTEEAGFQPMYLTSEQLKKSIQMKNEKSETRKKQNMEISFLPGPVNIPKEVQDAFFQTANSHRSPEFMRTFSDTKKMLCNFVNTKKVELFLGSGTLANDIVAGQISLIEGNGIILSNGEFGERLIDHAERQSLQFMSIKEEWGIKFRKERIENLLDLLPDVKWLWAVHCETSTGMLNDIEMLKSICRERGILLCLDCISSIGNVEVDLKNIFLASCVSGKALESFCGISMVFYNHVLQTSNKLLPRFLDLKNYADHDGVPFTMSSNLIDALHTSLLNMNLKQKIENVEYASDLLRKTLSEMGHKIVLRKEDSINAVITVQLDSSLNSEIAAIELKKQGILVSYGSNYLIERNWIQFCMMTNFKREEIENVIEILRCVLNENVLA